MGSVSRLLQASSMSSTLAEDLKRMSINISKISKQCLQKLTSAKLPHEPLTSSSFFMLHDVFSVLVALLEVSLRILASQLSRIPKAAWVMFQQSSHVSLFGFGSLQMPNLLRIQLQNIEDLQLYIGHVGTDSF